MYKQHIAFLHSSLLVLLSNVYSCIEAFFLLISCQTVVVYKDSLHSHQSSPEFEKGSSRIQNIEIKVYLSHLAVYC